MAFDHNLVAILLRSSQIKWRWIKWAICRRSTNFRNECRAVSVNYLFMQVRSPRYIDFHLGRNARWSRVEQKQMSNYKSDHYWQGYLATDVKIQPWYEHVQYQQGYLETDVEFQIWPYNSYRGYLETDVKFQIWQYNTYRGYLGTDVKFQIWPYNTYRGYLETYVKFKILTI